MRGCEGDAATGKLLVPCDESMVTAAFMTLFENRTENCGSSPESSSIANDGWWDFGQNENGNENLECDMFQYNVEDQANICHCQTGDAGNLSFCESHCTLPAIQEDVSLSQDEDDPFMDLASEETEGDDDDDICDYRFWSQGYPLDQGSYHSSKEQCKQNSHFSEITSRGESRRPDHPIPSAQLAGTSSDVECDGIRLGHLLLALAEAVASQNKDLAEVILGRLNELVSYTGKTPRRAAAYFCDALRFRMGGSRSCPSAGKVPATSRDQYLAALQILHEFTPFIKFAHFTANQAILEAVQGESNIHIIDYEIMEGVQWASLMQSLVSRKEGVPTLRITALCRPHNKCRMASVQETGRRLSEFAASINLPFSFAKVRLNKEEKFRPSSFKLSKGEALVVNCMVNLPHTPHRTATSLSFFLVEMKKLSPTIFTLVEEELGYSTQAFTYDFLQTLYHYSAIIDSLDATLLSDTVACTHVEKTFLASRITSTLTACSDSTHQEVQKGDFGRRKWRSLMTLAGFSRLSLSSPNLCQARFLLGFFPEGFQVTAEESNCVSLGWHSNPLFAASVWKC